MSHSPSYQKLTDAEIYQFLREHNFALLGFENGAQNYSLPLTFICDKDALLGRMSDPKALALIAINPTVTIQADLRKGHLNWTSVFGIGFCELLSSPLRAEHLKELVIAEAKNGHTAVADSFVRVQPRHLAGRKAGN